MAIMALQPNTEMAMPATTQITIWWVQMELLVAAALVVQ